jgi:hypothetical protein
MASDHVAQNPPASHAEGAELRERPVGDLVKDLAGQTSSLVRQEIQLAQAERGWRSAPPSSRPRRSQATPRRLNPVSYTPSADAAPARNCTTPTSRQGLLEPDAVNAASPVLRRARAQQCAQAYPTRATLKALQVWPARTLAVRPGSVGRRTK